MNVIVKNSKGDILREFLIFFKAFVDNKIFYVLDCA